MISSADLMIEATRTATRAASDYQQYISSLLTSNSMGAIGGDWQGHFSTAVDIYHRAYGSDHPKFIDALLTYSDRSSSTELLNALYERRAVLDSPNRKYTRRIKEGISLENELRYIQENGGSESEVVNKLNEIQDFKIELANSNSPFFNKMVNDLGMVRGQRITPGLIRKQLLDSTTAFIDVNLSLGKIYTTVVTPLRERVFITSMDKSLRRSLFELNGQEMRKLKLRKATYHLYDKVLKGAIEWINQEREIDQLIVTRNKNFTECNFGYFPRQRALSGKNWNEDNLLIHEFAITYAFSISTLLASLDVQQLRQPGQGEFGVFSNTSSAINREVDLEELDDLFNQQLMEATYGNPENRSFHTNTSPSNFITEVEKFRNVALVAHGSRDDDDFAKMYIHLAPDSLSKNGLMGISEVYNLTLSANMTLAINCKSGTGITFNNEGPKGFARAFLAAGSSAVIAGNDNLTDVYTARVMKNFVDFWIIQKMPAARAVQQAKIKFLESTDTVYPNTWGELTYYGLPNIYYDHVTTH